MTTSFRDLTSIKASAGKVMAAFMMVIIKDIQTAEVGMIFERIPVE